MIALGVVAHHSRRGRAVRLADHLGADTVAIDEGGMGAGRNHEVCYRWLAESGKPWSVILEDDAIPVNNFRDQLGQVLAAAPTGLLSLYLGRTRPPHWQPSIARVIARDEHFLMCSELLHHVAVAIRTDMIPALLAHLKANRRYQTGRTPIDEAVGQFSRDMGIRVGYTHPSIVDHENRLPTVIDRHISQHRADDGTRPATEIRRAWAFGVRPSWRASLAAIPDPADIAARDSNR